MSLLGAGVVLVWCDLLDAAREAHEAWHSYQHIPERLGIPGFLRARRGITAQPGAPRIFVLYEIESLDVVSSQAYFERLDHPTAWTRAMMASVKRLSRTSCRIVTSHGSGIGTHILTLRLSSRPGRLAALQAWLADEALPEMVRHPGLVSAHLLERDATNAPNATHEQRLRGRPDDVADQVIVIDGYDSEAVRGLASTVISRDRLLEHGASIEPGSAQYQIVHVASIHDAVADRSPMMEQIYRSRP